MSQLEGNTIDLEKRDSNLDAHHEHSQDNSQTSSDVGSPPTKVAADTESLSRIESAQSGVFDIASRVPTNASRESGIVGTDIYITAVANRQVGTVKTTP